jgi:methyl-accepting chemotaxis protein
LLQGPQYNKPFKVNIKALDEALGSFKERCDTLRDKAIVDTHKTVNTTHTLVGQLTTTTDEIDVTSKDTRERVQNLQSGAEDLLRTANGTDARLIQVSTEVHLVGEGINTRIGDVQATQRATRARIEDIHDAQHATHAAVDKMTEVQRAIHDATAAMTLARKNADCGF